MAYSLHTASQRFLRILRSGTCSVQPGPVWARVRKLVIIIITIRLLILLTGVFTPKMFMFKMLRGWEISNILVAP